MGVVAFGAGDDISRGAPGDDIPEKFKLEVEERLWRVKLKYDVSMFGMPHLKQYQETPLSSNPS